MKTLLLLAITIGVLVHGYFYMSFGTVDPCEAATAATIRKQQTEAGRALGSLVSGPIESRFRAKGAWTCYKAVFSENPEALLQ